MSDHDWPQAEMESEVCDKCRNTFTFPSNHDFTDNGGTYHILCKKCYDEGVDLKEES